MAQNDPNPQERVITVLSIEQFDEDWPPSDGLEFIQWFGTKIEPIPVEYLDSVRVEIDSIEGYENSHYARIEITYRRPETADEVTARLADYARRHQTVEAEERRQLALLAGKYGYTL